MVMIISRFRISDMVLPSTLEAFKMSCDLTRKTAIYLPVPVILVLCVALDESRMAVGLGRWLLQTVYLFSVGPETQPRTTWALYLQHLEQSTEDCVQPPGPS